MYFTAKISFYYPEPSTGNLKKTSKKYLVSGESIGDVEKQIHKNFPSNWKDLSISTISKSNVDDIFSWDDSEDFYHVRIGLIDDNNKTKYFYAMTNGEKMEDALIKINEYYKTSTSTYFVAGISKTKIIIDENFITVKIWNNE
jgi:hypothetical protein